MRLALSYAAFLMIAGALLLGAVWLFLLRYVPDQALLVDPTNDLTGPFPVRSNLLREFAPRAVAVVGVLLVVGLVGGWLLAGRMLAPLTRITEATRLAGHGALAHRIRLPGRSDEFRELADAFDTMLSRLEAHVDEQRRFAANASHELRTPLAITQSLLDVARADPSTITPDLVEHLHEVNARATELTEALLLLSRASQGSFAEEEVDLSLVAEEAQETLLPLAEVRGVHIEVTGEAATAIGSRPLLQQLTTNLLHNAIVHNLVAEGTATVTTGVREGAVELTVENTGAVLPPDISSMLTEPFFRGVERVHTDDHGVGLGLAIVESIVRAHDGALTFAPRQSGGLVVTVRLPSSRERAGGITTPLRPSIQHPSNIEAGLDQSASVHP